MKQPLRLTSRFALATSASLLSLAALGGCSGGGSSSVPNFEPIATKHPSAASSPVVVEGKWLVYLASEALSAVGGTNFNVATGDADIGDDCAVVVDMTNKAEVELNVATSAAKIVGNEIYLIVSESADSKDWSVPANGISGNVLLHYSTTLGLTYVDEIDPGTHAWAVAGGRLYYVRGDTTGLVNGQTSIAFLATTAPTTPVTVVSTDLGNTLFPEILAVDENLIFLVADEVVEGRDLNGDTDSTDNFVLGLLDGTDIAGAVQMVGLSLDSDTSPVRAHVTSAHDWVVGFLVDEATQSNFTTGLNDPTVGAFGFGGAWKPTNCAGYVDADTTDQVLHVLKFALWSIDPVLNAPENTGIPGTDRILCTSSAVATLVSELQDGGCDLNADGDTADKILRWVRISAPQLPFGTSTQLNAVDDSIPGGSSGISDLAGKFLCVVSENLDDTDHDADGLKNRNLVAWIDPNAGTPTWKFDHNPSTIPINSVGASALSDRKERDRMLVAFQESVLGQPINTGDNDTLDSVPTFALFDPNDPTDLDFPGPAVAIAAANPGIVIAGGFALYRVDESADNRDWNGDNVKNDFVLFRTTLSSNFSSVIGFNVRATANSLSGPVVTSSGDLGAAFLADESMAGTDLNVPTDGRSDGFVVTWFRIGS